MVDIKEHRIPEDYPSKEDLFKELGYTNCDRIGQGVTGFVDKYKDRNGRDIACKSIKLREWLRDEEKYRNVKTEVSIIRDKIHINVIEIIDQFIIKDNVNDTQTCYIFMEFANGGTVFNRMLDKKTNQYFPLNESKAKQYFR